jgi:hypothetical protein
LKDSFDYLKGKKVPEPQIVKFVAALGCELEVCSHLEAIKRKLTQTIRDELMKAVFPKKPKQPDHLSGEVFGVLMKELTYFDVPFSQFQEFCVEKLSLNGDYPSFVILSNFEIFNEYHSQISTLSPDLSPEEYKQKRGEIYADAMRNVENLCLDLIRQWTLFHNSDINWRQDETEFFHLQSQTSHRIDSRECLPYYLGTSVLIEEDPSETSKGKKKKGNAQGKKKKEKAQVNPAAVAPAVDTAPAVAPAVDTAVAPPEEKPQGTPVHVFMDGQSGHVFTMPISE